jgi:hypothetical protein
MSEDTYKTGRKEKKNDKDGWDKAQIVLVPVGGLLTAMAVAYLTFATSKRLSNWQERENNTRVFTDLMSKREDAETGLRKAMFDTIMQSFLESSSKSGPSAPQNLLEAEVLKIELLAYNFHEALTLTPLLKDFERKLVKRMSADPSDNVAKECLGRLRKVANDITGKQMAALYSADGRNSDVFLSGTFQEPLPQGGQYVTKTLFLDGVKHEITLGILKKDPDTQELQMSLAVRTNDSRRGADADQIFQRHAVFWVGSFEFPMIDNTRLPNDQFCAIILRVLDRDSVTNTVSYEVDVICFPGSRAALQEKPYYEEILDHLRQVDSTD